MIEYFKTELFGALYELSEEINTNIIPQQYGAFERNKHNIKYDSLDFGEGVYTDLIGENQALKERVNELETKYNKLLEISEKINDLEHRAKVWEE